MAIFIQLRETIMILWFCDSKLCGQMTEVLQEKPSCQAQLQPFIWNQMLKNNSCPQDKSSGFSAILVLLLTAY